MPPRPSRMPAAPNSQSTIAIHNRHAQGDSITSHPSMHRNAGRNNFKTKTKQTSPAPHPRGDDIHNGAKKKDVPLVHKRHDVAMLWTRNRRDLQLHLLKIPPSFRLPSTDCFRVPRIGGSFFPFSPAPLFRSPHAVLEQSSPSSWSSSCSNTVDWTVPAGPGLQARGAQRALMAGT